MWLCDNIIINYIKNQRRCFVMEEMRRIEHIEDIMYKKVLKTDFFQVKGGGMKKTKQ